MNPRVRNVRALNDYRLEIDFENGERGIFSMQPYLDYPVFAPLRDVSLFARAKAAMGFVSWDGEIDIDPDTLYLESNLSFPTQSV